MGGHGGMWLSIRHKDVFGAGGSTSGGVDIRPFPHEWKMKEQLGELSKNRQRWDEHTVMTQLDKIQNGDLALIIDCGTGDFFLEVNQKFHEELEKRMNAECGACEDKKRIATRAKQLNLDAIHDTVHEMAKDEARHGKGFEGLYNRYFKK